MRVSLRMRVVVGAVLASVIAASGARGQGEAAVSDDKKKETDKGPHPVAGHLPDDDRPDFDATFFIGSAIDNFAADDVSSYLNPDASGEPGTFERAIGGVQFAYRLFASTGGDKRVAGRHQLWTYGLTVHGVRSSDVDCKADPTIAVCEGFEDETDPAGRFLYIVRNASSLEAAVGLRWEFWTLRKEGDSPARLYAGLQAGFVSVAGIGEDVVDQHHFGIGAITSRGKFRESYLELGYGKSDLFAVSPNGRMKINALLSWVPERFEGKGGSAFARILVDSDMGDGADSIQSYFGLRFDLATLFAKEEVKAPGAAAPSDKTRNRDSGSGGEGAGHSSPASRVVVTEGLEDRK